MQQLKLFNPKDYKSAPNTNHIRKCCFNCKNMMIEKSKEWGCVFCRSKTGSAHIEKVINSSPVFEDIEKESDEVGAECKAFKPRFF